MPGKQADSGPGDVAAGSQSVEPQGQSETDQDQLAVHAQEGQKAIPVQETTDQRLNGFPPRHRPHSNLDRKPRASALRAQNVATKLKPDTAGEIAAETSQQRARLAPSSNTQLVPILHISTVSGGQRPRSLCMSSRACVEMKAQRPLVHQMGVPTRAVSQPVISGIS